MNWSISSHKTFNHCQRQWFYKFIVADGRVKKIPERVEITRLSKLKTIDAWRGEIVDRAISETMVNLIRQKRRVTMNDLMSFSNNVFEKQYNAILGKWDGWKPTFGFIDSEFNREIKKEKIEQAKEDIRLSFTNLLNNDLLMKELYDSDILFSQCSLSYKFGEILIRGTPDLLVFYKSKPPKIFDWKVHTFGSHSNEEQLILYAYLLKMGTHHSNFPDYLLKYKIEDIALSEVQLIANETGYTRDYQITEDKIKNLEELISSSMLSMYGVSEFKKYGEIQASDFNITKYGDGDNCTNCAFKKLCNQVES